MYGYWLLIFYLIKLSCPKPTLNSTVSEILSEYERDKQINCSYLESTLLVRSDTKFLLMCRNYEHAKAKEKALCTVYVEILKQLCTAFSLNSSLSILVTDDNIKKILSGNETNVKVLSEKATRICQQLSLLQPKEEEVKKELQTIIEDANCFGFCLGKDLQIMPPCSLGAYMMEILQSPNSLNKGTTLHKVEGTNKTKTNADYTHHQTGELPLDESKKTEASSKGEKQETSERIVAENMKNETDKKPTKGLDDKPETQVKAIEENPKKGIVSNSDIRQLVNNTSSSKDVSKKTKGASPSASLSGTADQEILKETSETKNKDSGKAGTSNSNNDRLKKDDTPSTDLSAKNKAANTAIEATPLSDDINIKNPVEGITVSNAISNEIPHDNGNKEFLDTDVVPPNPDEDQGDEMEENLDKLDQDDTEIDKPNEGELQSPGKPKEIDEDGIINPANYQTQDIDDGDSYFFFYFMIICMFFIGGYIVYHNKQRILALILEGRRGRKTARGRRPNSANYRKLDSTLEEAISSSCKRNTTQVIY